MTGKVLSLSWGISTHGETGQFQQSREAVSGTVGLYERLRNCRPATQVCSVVTGKCADPGWQEDDHSIFLWGQTLGVCHFCVVTVSVPSVLVPLDLTHLSTLPNCWSAEDVLPATNFLWVAAAAAYFTYSQGHSLLNSQIISHGHFLHILSVGC